MKIRKRRKFEKWRWLLIVLAAVPIVLMLLLLYKPAGFAPRVHPADKQVSPYLTHVLSPQLYNGAQRQEPFELVVLQNGINDMIVRSGWPKEVDGVRFWVPRVFFQPDTIVLMGTVGLGSAELVVTVVGKPTLNEDGLLNLRVAKVKVGAVGITPLARVIAKRLYQHKLDPAEVDPEKLDAQIAASLLDNKPFEPVFNIKAVFENKDKKLLVEKIAITEKRLTVRLVPAGE